MTDVSGAADEDGVCGVWKEKKAEQEIEDAELELEQDQILGQQVRRSTILLVCKL